MFYTYLLPNCTKALVIPTCAYLWCPDHTPDQLIAVCLYVHSFLGDFPCASVPGTFATCAHIPH